MMYSPSPYPLLLDEFKRRYKLRVKIDPELDTMALARGVWPFKRIHVHPEWTSLPPGEQYAILLHEAGHCLLLHLERRLLMLPVFWTKWAERRAENHEHEADAFCVLEGYGVHLRCFLARRDRGDHATGYFHPPVKERMANITKLLRESYHVPEYAA